MTKSSTQPNPSLSFIMDFEAGALSDTEIIEGFQQLIDSGLAWQLQGTYGRQAQALIDSGECTRPVNADQQSPALGEVRSSSAGRGTLPKVGPFELVARDAIRSVGPAKYRLVVYGAYNAYGLVGGESNGIAVLLEDPPSVIVDEILCHAPGHLGPSAAQLNLFETLRTCSDAEFRAYVNECPRLRTQI